jgi:capsular exopolysaccharide synthesis family protein
MDIELRHLLHTARRWWWLLPVLPILFAGLGVSLANRQADQYSATATILVAPNGTTSTTDYNAILTAQSLTTTYAALILTTPILQGVIDSLGLDMSTGALHEEVSVQPSATIQQIKINVNDPSPQRAADIANAVMDAFIARLQSDSAQTTNDLRFEVDRQVEQLNTQLGDLEDQIAVQDNLGTASNVIDTMTASADQLRTLLARLTQLQTTLSNNSLDTATSATQWQRATPASTPFAPRPSVNLIFGVIAGMVATAGLIVLLASLDNTVKTSLEGRDNVGLPVIATLSKISRLGYGRRRVFVITAPNTSATEEIRLLRTNLEYVMRSAESPLIGITSPGTGDGKSTLAANLSASLALAGYRTLLLDADLRRPKQHEIFQLQNVVGAKQVLEGEAVWSEAVRSNVVPNLSILTSGGHANNASDLLSVGRMDAILSDLKSTYQFVIVDLPPALGLSDAQIVSADLDGVLIAARSGKTQIGELRSTVDALRQSGAHPLGVTITAARIPSIDYYARATSGRFRWPLAGQRSA